MTGPRAKHWATALAILALAAVLRFWRLASKPLWADEIATAVFGFGRGYADIPVGIPFDPAVLPALVRWQPGASCAQIGDLLARESTHPPLFFCGMYRWLAGADLATVWQLRSLPALLGVVAVAAVYWLGRATFSPRAGLWAAAIMAVSPFGVYLSQEARQYSLLLVLVAIAARCTVALASARQRWGVWFCWGIVNALGCYVHYFFAVALAAQIGVVAIATWRQQARGWPRLGLTLLAMGASYLPWLPVAVAHFGSPKASWLPQPQGIAPVLQSIAGWVVAVVVLPIEGQSLPVQVLCGVGMLAAATAFYGGMVLQWQQGWRQWPPLQRRRALALGGFVLLAIGQFLGIAYLLGKDLTVAPRYNYVYFPVLCCLLGAGLAAPGRFARPLRIGMVALGLVGASCVALDLAFQKPYLPGQVAARLKTAETPLLVALTYGEPLDLALGSSILLALDDRRTPEPSTRAVFLERGTAAGDLNWPEELARLPVDIATDRPAEDLWVVGPQLRRADFPEALSLGGDRRCQLNPQGYFRLGVPYQHYRCSASPNLDP